jgi:hypothetical protein
MQWRDPPRSHQSKDSSQNLLSILGWTAFWGRNVP